MEFLFLCLVNVSVANFEKTDGGDYLIFIFQYNLILGTESAPVVPDADSDSTIIGARVSALKVNALLGQNQQKMA